MAKDVIAAELFLPYLSIFKLFIQLVDDVVELQDSVVSLVHVILILEQ